MARSIVLACLLFLFAILVQGVAFAAPQGKLCSVVRLKTLKQYVLRNEVICFTSSRKAERAGFLLLSRSMRSTPGFRKSSVCGFLGLAKTGRYVPRRLTGCMSSVHSASSVGLKHYPVESTPAPGPSTTSTAKPTQNPPTPPPTQTSHATPTVAPTQTPQATPTSTPMAGGPTPTPTPSTYKVSLIEDDGSSQQGTPEGSCTGTLSNGVMTLDCSHSNGATTAHIHFAPDNTEYCGIENPPPTFQIVCPLSAEHLESLHAGKMFLAVEGGPGPEANGYVLPAP